MIKTVRDDVIKLDAFVAAAFKYDEELAKLYDVGGYCLVSQLKNIYGESKSKRMLEDMIDNKLIATEYYSNSKFAYITQNALKYLANKNNISETINIKKKNVEKNPVEKILVASIIKYEIEPGYIFLRRSNYIKKLEEKILEIKGLGKFISIDILSVNKEKYIKNKKDVMKLIEIVKPHIGDNNNLKKIIETSDEKYKEKIKMYEMQMKNCYEIRSKLDIYTKTAITLFDMSKIILLPEDGDTLLFYIIDYSKIKSIKKYFQDILTFEKTVGRIFKNIKISFISYKKERFEIFGRRLRNYLKEAQLNRNVELIEVDKCYYLERIIERTANQEIDEIEIKPKDKKDYQKIKQQLSDNSANVGEII